MQCPSENLSCFPLLSYFTFLKSCRDFSRCSEKHQRFSKMRVSFTRIFPARSLNFLGSIKNFSACRPAACKKFKQSQLVFAIWVFWHWFLLSVFSQEKTVDFRQLAPLKKRQFLISPNGHVLVFPA